MDLLCIAFAAVIVALVIAVRLSIPSPQQTRNEIRRHLNAELATRNPEVETWTREEMDMPGVNPRNTNIPKAKQLEMSRRGLLGAPRKMLVRGRYPGLLEDAGIETVDGEVVDEPQLPSGRQRLLLQSENSKRLLR